MAKTNELDFTEAFIPKPVQLFGQALSNMVTKMKNQREREKLAPQPKEKMGKRIMNGFKSFGKTFKNSMATGGTMAQMLPPPVQWGLDRLLNGKTKAKANGRKNKDSQVDSTETVKLLTDQVDQGVEIINSNEHEIELLDEMIAFQEESVDLLKKIDKNTTPDTLKQREDELENKKRANRLFGGAAANDAAMNDKKGGLGSIISGVIGDLLGGAVAGWLGAKGLKGAGIFGKGAATGAAGAAAGAAKKPGFFKRAAGSMKGVPGLVAKAVTGGAALAGTGVAAAKTYLGNTNVVKNSTQYLETLKDGAKGALTNIPETAKPVTSAIASGAQKAKEIGGNVAQGGKAVISTLSEKASNMFGGAKNWLSNTASSVADGASNAASSVAKSAPGFLDKAKNFGAKGLKALGMPLTVATTLYDVNEVASDDKLSDSEKNKEYTKIGTKLAGMWAGAKAGAAAGAMGGGAVGAAFGGVGAAPGAAVGGILGGIAGAFGGYELGDVVGEKLGNAAFDVKENANPDAVTVESVIPQPAKATQKIQTALRLGGDAIPKSVSDYVNNVGSNKYEDIKNDYYSYLTKQGIEFDDNTAINAISKVKQDSLQFKAKIEKMDTFANLKYNDPTDVIKKVANSASAIQNISTKNEYEDVTVGETRNTALQTLSHELEENNIEASKPTVIQQPIILPNPSGGGGNGGSINTGESQNRNKLAIPNTRNQDGTLERLLNFTYRPLLD